jgi:hypothetical protein
MLMSPPLHQHRSLIVPAAAAGPRATNARFAAMVLLGRRPLLPLPVKRSEAGAASGAGDVIDDVATQEVVPLDLGLPLLRLVATADLPFRSIRPVMSKDITARVGEGLEPRDRRRLPPAFMTGIRDSGQP